MSSTGSQNDDSLWDDERLPALVLIREAAAVLGRMIQGIRTGNPYTHLDNDSINANPVLRAALWQAAYVLEKAFRRRYRVAWAVRDYMSQLTPRQDGRNADREGVLSKEFPAGAELEGNHSVPEMLPAIIVDAEGHILLCYLPNCVSPAVMRILDAAVGALATRVDGQLEKKKRSREAERAKVEKQKAKGKSKQQGEGQERLAGNWREGPELFRKGKCNMNPGVLTFAPAWWPVGHENQLPGPASTLKPPNGDGRQFLKDISLASALIGAILSQINEPLFEAGIKVLTELHSNSKLTKDHATVSTIIEMWFSPFSSLSLIINRETPTHRDTSGPICGMDLLVTGGNYSNGVFLTPTLNRRWTYNPGCVIVLLGKAVLHGVPQVNGERYCLAYFWREGLFDAAGVQFPFPSTWETSLSSVPESLCWSRDSGGR
ncbi:hypothetical protein CC1G_02483 [Coprinopsis cinerea okayama7|uniref:2OGFeDO JBP1/TET oxygenase domain-containing protein n=1 Tax=Coprinopsis cinerea (strain Okayama-7 / 130 / ATCC MYA-4618 / FGSC 9003) TaxID=240176 RepID=A8NBM3_COPC7|nr:hypothetical protein CC1G_02483 [Coprinopsis cinerea okayama7\|eukprot:XP_001832221.2 hypothetical protein CC1G_02483 [Coprinopsis cinerea okayama7\